MTRLYPCARCGWLIDGGWYCGGCGSSAATGGPPPRELARRADPPQSKQAAREIQPMLGRLQREAVDAVRLHPRKTARELADLLRLRDPRTLNRRLTEVRRKGLIRAAEVRRCAVTGRNAAAWVAVPGP